LDPQGPVSSAERLILLNATGIMLVVVVPVIVLTLAFAWWYRASNSRASYQPDWEYSGRIELVVWSIPTMVVILLAGVAWIGAHDFDPAAKAKPLQVVSVETAGELDLVDIAIDDPAQLYVLGNGAVSHNCTIGMGYHYRARYEFVLFFEKGKRKLNDLGIADVLINLEGSEKQEVFTSRIGSVLPTREDLRVCGWSIARRRAIRTIRATHRTRVQARRRGASTISAITRRSRSPRWCA